MTSGLVERDGTVGAYLAVSFEAFFATLAYEHDRQNMPSMPRSPWQATVVGVWRLCTALLGKAKLTNV